MVQIDGKYPRPSSDLRPRSAYDKHMTTRLAQLMQFHKADPADTFATYGIAMEYAKTDQLQQAIAWMDKTLVIDPDHAYACYQKARFANQLGDQALVKQSIDAGLAAAERKRDAKAQAELISLKNAIG